MSHRNDTAPFKIPKPTWSIDDLDLTFQKEKPIAITDEELDRLAKKAVLNVSSLTSSERDDLKLQLSKIMKCISLVTQMDHDTDSVDDGILSEKDMYDTPRGFGSTEFCTPVRNEEEELTAWSEYTRKQSHCIMDQLKEHKMVERNGETYFQLIVNKEET
jgi:Asp-tRNA(Asn)/Glu-tRNA(Gln) amidotransferase C subunit